MRYAYICRCPNDNGPFRGYYAIKYVDTTKEVLGGAGEAKITVDIENADPPVLRRKRGGHSEWDYANELKPPKEFHQLHVGIHLECGEGPILVDLDRIGEKRTSKDPLD